MNHSRHPHAGAIKRNGFALVIVFLLLLLVGCGGTPTTPASEAPATNVPASTTAASDAVTVAPTTEEMEMDAPTEAATTEAQGTLRFGFNNRFLTWDPHQEQRPITLMGYQLVYDALLAEDAAGNLIPGLATEWNQTAEMVELTLREGVVFHDGTPFDAEVAKANLLRARDEGAPPIAQQLTAVESIDVLDSSHLRLNLSAPVPDLLSNLARSAGMMISPASFDAAAELPVGTGPWVFNADESTADVQYVFDRFPDFWDPAQQGLERVVLVILPDQVARVNALRGGEVDATSVTAADAAALEADGFTLLTNESVHLALHILDREGTMVPAFADERVRLAISYAIDRETYVDVVNSGYGEAMTQRFRPGQYGYAADLTDLSYNPDRARELLAEAGVENLEFTVPIAGTPEIELQALAGFLQEVGITMNIATIAPGTLVQETSAGKWAAAVLPLNEPHVATYIANRVQTNGFLNPFKVTEPDLEELAVEARQLPPAEAEPLWAELTRATAERGIIIHICSIPSLVFTTPNVRGGEVGYLQPNVLNLRGVTIAGEDEE